MSGQLPVGTSVVFQRTSKSREWDEIAVIVKVNPFGYLLRTERGSTFIRTTEEVKEVSDAS